MSTVREYMDRQDFVCNVLQRAFAKRLTGRYRFPRDMYASIAEELRCSVDIVEMVIAANQ